MAFRLVSISCSETSLCVSSSFLFTQSSITTGDDSSWCSSLTSHVATTYGYVILGSFAFLFLYWTVLSLSYSWDDNYSPFLCTLCKFISLEPFFNSFHINYRSFHKKWWWKVRFIIWWEKKILFLCIRKTGLRHSQTFLIKPCAHFLFAWRICITMNTLNIFINISEILSL